MKTRWVSLEEFKEMYPAQNQADPAQNCAEPNSQEAKMCTCKGKDQWCPDCIEAAIKNRDSATTTLLIKDMAPEIAPKTFDLGNQIDAAADTLIRSRIERLADKILSVTDLAGSEDHMTVAEIMGVLEMCKVSVANKAFEVV